MAGYQIGTENQVSSCPCQSRLLWLPLNPMECGIVSEAYRRENFQVRLPPWQPRVDAG